MLGGGVSSIQRNCPVCPLLTEGGGESKGRMVFGLYTRTRASCPGLLLRINPDYQSQNSKGELKRTSKKDKNQEPKCEGEDRRHTLTQCAGKAAHRRKAGGRAQI